RVLVIVAGLAVSVLWRVTRTKKPPPIRDRARQPSNRRSPPRPAPSRRRPIHVLLASGVLRLGRRLLPRRPQIRARSSVADPPRGRPRLRQLLVADVTPTTRRVSRTIQWTLT